METKKIATLGQLVQEATMSDAPLLPITPAAEMLEPQQFTFNFGDTPIRSIITPEGEPLFCLADVVKGCDLKNPSHAAAAIKSEFKGSTLNVYPLQTAGGVQSLTMITEPQLYFVAMRGRSQVAHEFRQWICNEVIPQLRKHGSYHLRAPLPELPQRDLSGHYNVSYVTIANAMADALGLDDHGKMIFSWIIERAKAQGYAIAQDYRRPAAPKLHYDPAQLDLIAMERAKSLCAIQMASERAELQSAKSALDEAQKKLIACTASASELRTKFEQTQSDLTKAQRELAQTQSDLEQSEHEKEALEQAYEQLQQECDSLTEQNYDQRWNAKEEQEELKKRCNVLERLAFLLLSVPDSEDAKKLAKAILG